MDTWPIWLPVLSLVLFFDVWVSYIQGLGKERFQWSFLEVRIPREILKGPRVMEQLFASLHSIKSTPDWYDAYWLGDIATWYSFEIVSQGGEVHFYVRTPSKFRILLEAVIHSFYSDADILEVGDYVEEWPDTTAQIYTMGYNIWGSEFILAKEDGYPIRTHREFESMDEYNTMDPIATLLEILAKIRPDEQIWIQFLILTADAKWREGGQKLIKELRDKTIAAGVLGGQEYSMVDRTPGQVQVMKAIEESIAKPGFSTLIRGVYLGPANNFRYDILRKGVLGAFNQYSSQALNSFKHKSEVQTYTQWYFYPYFFPKWRLEYRKQRILKRFRERTFPKATFFGLLATGNTLSRDVYVLNTEELATLYHFPTNLVLTAPMIKRVEAKKVGPPAGLPIYGAEATAEEQLPPGFTFK